MRMLVVTRCLMLEDGDEKNLLSKELINKPVELIVAVTMLLLLCCLVEGGRPAHREICSSQEGISLPSYPLGTRYQYSVATSD